MSRARREEPVNPSFTNLPRTVMEWDRSQTLVYFRSIGVKKLATTSANFAMVGGEAPKKKSANGKAAGKLACEQSPTRDCFEAIETAANS